MMTFLILFGGLIILTLGGDLLVRGGSGLAARLGVSPLVIGLTVVAFGTSAPELAVSLKAAINGQADIAVGNVVGSNIFNVVFILGISALIIPLAVHENLLKFDVPVMILASLLFALFGWDGELSRTEGSLLFLMIFVYLFRTLKLGQKPDLDPELVIEGKKKSVFFLVTLIVIGLVALVFGAKTFLSGAIEIARLIGISELVIGLTIVAAGTSLPEVAASVMAAIKGERDMAIGNVVGSNIFNILVVLGLSSIITPIKVSAAAMSFDIPVMIAIAVLCYPIFWSNKEISRKEGASFLLIYGLYVGYLLNSAA
jgi:cation:H+ antiporter